MSEEDRARQARVHAMMNSGESVLPDSTVPTMHRTGSNSHGSVNSKSSSSSPRSGSHGSPAHSRDQSGLPVDTIGVGLRFAKEELVVSPADRPSSTLAQQLQLARSALDDNFPRSSSMSPVRFTVYMPHEEGSMVQISVPPVCTAHQLVKEALACAVEENGGSMPVGLIDDPWSYRVFIAEEDGEVDDDFPVLDVRTNVCALEVETFVLRDRVDAAAPVQHPSPQTRGTDGRPPIPTHSRPAAGSIIKLGPGANHSESSKSSNSKKQGFATLETDEGEQPAKSPQEADKSCACACAVQ